MIKTIKVLLIFLFFNTYFSGISQELWSLEHCIQHAFDNNIQIKQQELNVQINENNHQQSLINVAPTVNAGASYSFNYGRALDQTTYEFSDSETAQSSNMYISGNLTLFNGLQKYNTIQQRKFDLLASIQSVEKLKNDISLTIASAYLQILFNKEILTSAVNQLDITNQQVSRTQHLVNAGSLAQGSLLEIQAQQASEEMQVVNAENQLELSLLTLKQLLDLEEDGDFDIEIPDIEITQELNIESIGDVYNTAATGLPNIKIAELDLKSFEKGLDIARGMRSPSISMGYSYNTGYFDTRSKILSQTMEPFPIGVTEVSGETVLGTAPVYVYGDYPFMDQISDNASQVLSFNLSVPIFNGWQVNTNISNAKIAVMNANYNLENSKNQLYKDIQQAHADAKASLKRYYASEKTVNSMQEAFRYTQQKFEVGSVNSLDFNTSKNQLTNAESDLLQSKYDFIFKTKILDFYQGIPIKL